MNNVFACCNCNKAFVFSHDADHAVCPKCGGITVDLNIDEDAWQGLSSEKKQEYLYFASKYKQNHDESDEEKNKTQPPKQKKHVDKNNESLKENGKKITKAKIAVITGVILFVAILFGSILFNSTKTIDLNKYLIVEPKGYDGYGTVKISIDWDSIEEKYGDRISFTNAAKRKYGVLLNVMSPVDAVKEHIRVKIGSNDGLSNGDVVYYSWKIDEDFSKYVKCKVKCKDGTYTVSGLAEIGTFDVFEDINVQLSGIAPRGKAEIIYYGSELNPNDFRCSKTDGLKNGDVISVFLSNNNMEYYAKNLGKIPETTSKEYTVNGLAEYVSSYSGLTDGFIADAKCEAEDFIYSYTAKSYDKTSALNNLVYAGYIFDYVKDASRYVSNYNDLYLIYKGDVSSSDNRFSTSKVYFPVKYENILRDGETLSYSNTIEIAGSSRLDGNMLARTDGYINPLVCYMEIVESNRDNYIAECGDGFEIYSEYERIEKLDDISESYRETLRTKALEKIEGVTSGNYFPHVSGNSFVEDLSFLGEYLLLSKSQGNDFQISNKYFAVYSGTLSNSEGRFEPTTVYFPVEYDGIVQLPGNEYMITATVGMVGRSNIPHALASTYGYLDESEMYSEIVTQNRDKYTYDISDGLKDFGK